MPIDSNAKGGRFERKIANLLKPVWPDAYRTGKAQGARHKGGDGCDVEGTPFFVEAKDWKTVSLAPWHKKMDADQAKANDHRPQVLVYKLRRGLIMARMRIGVLRVCQVYGREWPEAGRQPDDRGPWVEIELSDWIALL